MKKVSLTFILTCMLFLSACSNSKCPQSMIDYTQENVHFSLYFLTNSYTVQVFKDPICVEVKKDDKEFLVNIIYLQNRENNGEYTQKTFVYFDDFMSGKLEDLEGANNNYYYDLTDERIANLKLAKDIVINLDSEDYLYDCDIYSAKYTIIEKELIMFDSSKWPYFFE